MKNKSVFAGNYTTPGLVKLNGITDFSCDNYVETATKRPEGLLYDAWRDLNPFTAQGTVHSYDIVKDARSMLFDVRIDFVLTSFPVASGGPQPGGFPKIQPSSKANNVVDLTLEAPEPNSVAKEAQDHMSLTSNSEESSRRVSAPVSDRSPDDATIVPWSPPRTFSLVHSGKQNIEIWDLNKTGRRHGQHVGGFSDHCPIVSILSIPRGSVAV